MTDGDGSPARAGRSETLGLRLALTFLAIALVAVALLAGLTAASAAADVANLTNQQRGQLTNAIAVAAGAAWDKNDSWKSADLSPVLDLAKQADLDVRFRDQAGHLVISSPGFAAQSGRSPARRSWSGVSGSATSRPGSPVRV